MSQSKKVALTGVLAGLSITTMLMGYLIPFATYATPCIASLFIIPVLYEYKEKTALTFYIAVSLLSILFIPDKELALMYCFVFGFYNVIKIKLERKFKNPLKFIIKILYAITSLSILYCLLLLIFPVQALLNEFSDYTPLLSGAFVILFIITFLIFDKLIERLTVLYVYKFRKKLFKK